MPQRYGIDNSSFDVSDVDRYLARNKPQKTTTRSMTHEIKRGSEEWEDTFGTREINKDLFVETKDGNISFTNVAPSATDEKKRVWETLKPGEADYKAAFEGSPALAEGKFFIQRNKSTGSIVFKNIEKTAGKVSYEQFGKGTETFKDYKDKGLGLQDDDLLTLSSEGKASILKGSEPGIEYKYFFSGDKEFEKEKDKRGLDPDVNYIEYNTKNKQTTIKTYDKNIKKAAKKPSDEKLYADNFGRVQWKQDAAGDWKTKFIKEEGGQRAEDRFENIAQELNRKDADGKYVNDSKYHKRLRNTLNSYYGGRDPEYLAKISKDIASRGKVDATDDFSINTEYGQNIDKILQRYTLHVDDAGVKSIKYQESSQDRISKQAPLASILNLFKSAKDDKALIWTKDDQSYYDEKRDREEDGGTEVFTDDDIPEADLPKFNIIPDPDGGFKFVANPEYLNYTEKLTSTENAQLAALNQSLDRNLNTLMDVAPNIYRDLNTAGKISPDILYNQGQVLLNSLIQSQKSE